MLNINASPLADAATKYLLHGLIETDVTGDLNS